MVSNLDGQKIKLRALEPSDIDFLLAIENNTNLWFVSESNLPLSKAILENYISNASQDIFEARQFRFVIEFQDNLAGLIDVFDFDPVSQKAGVGIVVLEKFRNKGLATDAIQTLQSFAYKIWHIHQFYAHISSDNSASLKAFKKCEFQESGLLKDWKKWNGEFVSMHLLQWFSNS